MAAYGGFFFIQAARHEHVYCFFFQHSYLTFCLRIISWQTFFHWYLHELNWKIFGVGHHVDCSIVLHRRIQVLCLVKIIFNSIKQLKKISLENYLKYSHYVWPDFCTLSREFILDMSVNPPKLRPNFKTGKCYKIMTSEETLIYFLQYITLPSKQTPKHLSKINSIFRITQNVLLSHGRKFRSFIINVAINALHFLACMISCIYNSTNI